MSELRRLCDLAVSLPTPRAARWLESGLNKKTYQEAVDLGRVAEWWSALAKEMAKLNLPEDEFHELEFGDWGDST